VERLPRHVHAVGGVEADVVVRGLDPFDALGSDGEDPSPRADDDASGEATEAGRGLAVGRRFRGAGEGGGLCRLHLSDRRPGAVMERRADPRQRSWSRPGYRKERAGGGAGTLSSRSGAGAESADGVRRCAVSWRAEGTPRATRTFAGTVRTP